MLDFWRWFPADGRPPRQGWWLVPLALWAALALPVGIARAQWAVDGFDPGADGEVNAVAVQRDGRIVVGGSFNMLGGAPHNYIGRLNADGSPDPSFTLGTDSFVEALAVQADGKILIGGGFNMLDGTTHNESGRVNVDGSADTSFNAGTNIGVNTGVGAIAVQADGKIVVAGSFNMLGGVARDNIGRLNADGSVDTSFDLGANSPVLALALQTDGKIVVGGTFSMLGGAARNAIGRLSAAPQQSIAGDNDGCQTTATLPGANTWLIFVPMAALVWLRPRHR